MLRSDIRLILNILVSVNIHYSLQCPKNEMTEAKAAHKSGEISDQSPPVITFDKIKIKLRDTGVFDWQDHTLTDRERKELGKLFDALEIMIDCVSTFLCEFGKVTTLDRMTTSRNRQPSNVQNMFSSLRLVERVVKKQLKEGQISDTLAAKFKWNKLSTRQRRSKPSYYFDKTTNMRVFNTKS